jgi:DNA-directed RNA polymerase specialized sigma24 family protein
VAQYLLANEAKIRAIARRKLTSNTRSVFDSEDVFSSVLRRMDELTINGGLRPRSEAELWAFVEAITRNNAVNRTRLIERARSRLTEDGPYAYELLRRLNAFATDDEATVLVLRMMLCLKNEEDRQLLSLLHRGAEHRAIGTMLRISEEASRQRWARIRKELLDRFAEGVFDG